MYVLLYKFNRKYDPTLSPFHIIKECATRRDEGPIGYTLLTMFYAPESVHNGDARYPFFGNLATSRQRKLEPHHEIRSPQTLRGAHCSSKNSAPQDFNAKSERVTHISKGSYFTTVTYTFSTEYLNMIHLYNKYTKCISVTLQFKKQYNTQVTTQKENPSFFCFKTEFD